MSCEKVPIFFPDLFEAAMSDNRTYRFKSFLLNVGERQLFNGEAEVPLTPKTFDVLVHLVENAGRLVPKDDLMKAVWPDSFVEEVNIPRAVHHLRKTLGQDSNGSKFIETVPTKGYRFVAKVSPVSAASVGDQSLEHDVAISESPGPSRPRRGNLLYLTVGLIVISALTSGWYAGLFGSNDTVPHSRGEHSQNGQAYKPLSSGQASYRP